MQDHFRHVMPSTILKDWKTTSLWRESAAMGVQGVLLGSESDLDCIGEREAWEVEHGDTRISK